MTSGRVMGIDASPGMEAEARRGGDADITFEVASAESLDMPQSFDVIFCNSALQWFADAPRALRNCWAALRGGGRMAVQAPAGSDYSPNFVAAFAGVGVDERTRDYFSGFGWPWFWAETAKAYAEVFAAAGFTVLSAEIVAQRRMGAPEDAMRVFESGAAAAYMNPDCYTLRPPDEYFAAAREIVLDGLRSQATDGRLELCINRLYLLARKPEEGTAARAAQRTSAAGASATGGGA